MSCIFLFIVLIKAKYLTVYDNTNITFEYNQNIRINGQNYNQLNCFGKLCNIKINSVICNKKEFWSCSSNDLSSDYNFASIFVVCEKLCSKNCVLKYSIINKRESIFLMYYIIFVVVFIHLVLTLSKK